MIIDIDGSGNILTLVGNNIKLRLLDKNRALEIGVLNRHDKWIFCKRNESKGQRMRAGNRYGFNYAMLKCSTIATHILLKCESGKYKIPIDFIMEKNNYGHHKKAGMEKQLFVNVDDILQFKTNL